MQTISVLELKQKNKAAGGYFFSPGAMKGFNSIVYPGVVTECGLILFITSEKQDDNPRRYTVRVMIENGRVQCTMAGFQEFKTKKAAVEFMTTLYCTINHRYPFDLIQINELRNLIYLYDIGAVCIHVYTVNNALHTSYKVPDDIRHDLNAVDEYMTKCRWGVVNE